jgi:hypothetical protein
MPHMNVRIYEKRNLLSTRTKNQWILVRKVQYILYLNTLGLRETVNIVWLNES